MMLEVGDNAPEFTQLTHQGKSVSLADLRGRKVLLWFFPEAGSPGCTTEAKSFQEHRPYFDENNVMLVGANLTRLRKMPHSHKSSAWIFHSCAIPAELWRWPMAPVTTQRLATPSASAC